MHAAGQGIGSGGGAFLAMDSIFESFSRSPPREAILLSRSQDVARTLEEAADGAWSLLATAARQSRIHRIAGWSPATELQARI